MGKSTSRKLGAAVEAFGELPPDVLALGTPLSIHPPGRLSRAIPPALAKAIVPALVTIMLLIAAGCTAMYLAGVPLGQATPDVWMAITAPMLLFSVVTVVVRWLNARAARENPEQQSTLGVLVYPEAIVRAVPGGFDVIRWEEVRELHAPASKSVWAVVADDGRRIDLPGWVADHTDAVMHITQRAEAVLLPRFLARIEAGKKVMFGPFGLSRRFLYSKGDKLAWDDVTNLVVVDGRLRVSRGKVLPWCEYMLMAYPNGFLAHELVRRLAPPHLLVPE
jgi:hypothetical protein